MIRSDLRLYAVGAATAWMPLYLVAFVALSVYWVLNGGPTESADGGIPSSFVVLFILHLFTILLSFALMVVYIVDIFRNALLTGDTGGQIMWVVLNVVVGPLAGIVYWWRYLRPGSELLRRRRHLASVDPTAPPAPNALWTS